MVQRRSLGKLVALVALVAVISVATVASTVSAQDPLPEGWEQAVGEHVQQAGEAAERGDWQGAVNELEALGRAAGELAPTPPVPNPEEGAPAAPPDGQWASPESEAPLIEGQGDGWHVLGDGGWVYGRMDSGWWRDLANSATLPSGQKVDVSPWMMDVNEFMYHGEPGVYSQKELVDEAWQHLRGDVHEGSFSSVTAAVSYFLDLLRDRIGEVLNNLFGSVDLP